MTSVDDQDGLCMPVFFRISYVYISFDLITSSNVLNRMRRVVIEYNYKRQAQGPPVRWERLTSLHTTDLRAQSN